MICLTRAAYQQVWEGRLADADRTIALIGDPRDADVLSRAQVADLIALRHYSVGDLGPSCPLMRDVHDAFVAAGDANNALVARIVLAWGRIRCGVHDSTAETMRALVVESAGRGIIEAVAKFGLAYALLDRGGDLDEAEVAFHSLRTYYASAGSVRYHGWVTIHLAWCALERNAPAEALELARDAIEIVTTHPVLLGHALALQAQALALLDRYEEALVIAMRAFELTEQLGGASCCRRRSPRSCTSAPVIAMPLAA